MSAFLIANVEVTNPDQYKQYQEFSSIAMQTHNVKVRVRGGKTLALEGDAPLRTVVMEFDTLEQAQAFYESQEYRRARQARDGAANMTMYVVEGL
ncbi:DUF1330 domain-containing protein [Alcaligenes sp. SDU_A2]|uniref:DUF1330 domain-containing protein n=1 Tax=Alcaligenes sp. SDU_A2 TaxID=3136634 RepID=UPI002BCA2326|nr:DUF1330 domain-containing protein [Alcaligenes sp.]